MGGFGLAWLLLCFVFGIVAGYLFFFFRYENRHIVDELRKTLKQSNKDKLEYQGEYEEYKAQNSILKEKLQTTLQKNTDLSKVVSELSRYYYKIKLGSEKVKDLSRDLEIPDETILGQMQQYMEKNGLTKEIDIEDETKSIKTDFF